MDFKYFPETILFFTQRLMNKKLLKILGFFLDISPKYLKKI